MACASTPRIAAASASLEAFARDAESTQHYGSVFPTLESRFPEGMRQAGLRICTSAEIVADAAEIYARSDMIIKVKEPLAQEWPMMRPGQIMFTYFHFAADEKLTRGVLETGATAVAYETVMDRGRLPILVPMSEDRTNNSHTGMTTRIAQRNESRNINMTPIAIRM